VEQDLSRSTHELERTLTGHTDNVQALLSVRGRLISYSDDHTIRVWHFVVWWR
jgi:WD40 repeat protein